MTSPTSMQDLQDVLAQRPRQNGEVTTTATIDGRPVEPGELVVAPPAPPAPAEAPARPEVDFTQTVPKVVGGLPYARAYMKLALTISGTEMVPGAMRGRSDAVMAAMMMGYELGLGPMQSLDSFHVIDGKVGLSAEAMRALVLQAGHMFVLSATNESATVRCRRKDWPEGEVATFEYTMEDAKRAGLLAPSRSGKPTAWQKFPRALLSARVSSEACRATFPDVLKGMSYTPEELTDMGEAAGAPEPAAAPEPSPAARAEQPAEPEEVAPPAAGLPADASPPAAAAPVNLDPPYPTNPPAAPSTGTEKQEMVRALSAVINGLPDAQATLCRAYLATHGYKNASRLTMEHLQEAINIAAGWPTSVAQQDFAPGEEEAVDAEIVDDEHPALFDE